MGGVIMKFHVAISVGDKFADIVEVDNVREVIVSSGVYYLKDEKGKLIFTSPLEKTAYVKRVE